MIIVTKNSTYEFDSENSRYRKIKPECGEWKVYYGFASELKNGVKAKIVRDDNRTTITSIICEIQEDDEDEV